MAKFKIGLIGFSIGGQVFHAPFIAGNPDLELYKVTARKADQQALLASRYPTAIAVPSADDIINDPDVDLVVVATSNDVHFELTKQALEAGKHVVVEKPFTNTVAEADALLALAKEKGLLLTVHHNARFHSDYKTVKKLIESGRLGPLVNYQARYDRFRNFLRPGAWREIDLPGSGIHYDLGAHLLDQALQLFGKPERIFADLRRQREGAQAVDDFEFILSYPKLKVSLFGQMLAKEPTPRFALYGWNGSFVKHGVDPQENLLRAGALPHESTDWGKEGEEIQGVLNIIENGADHVEKVVSEVGTGQDFYKNVASTLKGESSFTVTAAQGRDVIRLLELAEQSWAEQRTITLAPDDLIAY
ncbi:Gfo/Idh/MocA family oxidoreductase [Sphingobacterium psychroaquaticum]|uniref:Predicted dehydrogenase n=1 Tax=Sphingobacterium psychroaquaticum TaxID=561061 RepID=A0A1X7I8D3_9SPHI|nr:Gfo/Idh/MocA family oxidoreductase [Sphingobacterium psychroaquaticum]QBQ41838.1 oxidoreductase [Sphingobacterium psychroaquaticum]SMG10625.1 Predicted dehydrogenase [Sphingobacterium psychroaquaticum]